MKKYILLPFFALIVLFLQQSVAQDIPYYKFIRYSANVLH